MNKVNELRPFQKKVELNVKVLEKNEIREVTSKLDNSSHKVTEALVGDETGTILLTLWDDMIDRVETDKTYKINNAYTSLFKNTLRLNIGRYGELSDSDEEVSEVNKDNNLSDKEFEQRGRFGNRNRFGGGRRFERREESSQESDASEQESDETDSSDESEEKKESEEPKETESESKESSEETDTEPEKKPEEEKKPEQESADTEEKEDSDEEKKE